MSASHEPELAAFSLRVREALVAPEGSPLATLFTAATITALVVDFAEARADERVPLALLAVRDGLERVGVPRGRQFVLVGGTVQAAAPGVPGVKEWLAGLGQRLALTVLAHDPSRWFTAGRTPAREPIELDDELREAEAIVCIGRGFATAGRVHGGPFLLVPGVASLATAQAWAARRAEAGERGALSLALAAEEQAPVDLAIHWDDRGDRVRAGRGRTQFAALAREAGFA